MCLAVPARIVRCTDAAEALCDFGGVQKTVDVSLITDPAPGDWVIVHVGFALEKIDEKRAEETLVLLAQVTNAAASPEEKPLEKEVTP